MGRGSKSHHPRSDQWPSHVQAWSSVSEGKVIDRDMRSPVNRRDVHSETRSAGSSDAYLRILDRDKLVQYEPAKASTIQSQSIGTA